MADKYNNDELIFEIKERFKACDSATEELYRTMVDDLNFLEGEGKQWPDDIKKQRVADGRPCLEINKLPAFHDRIVGDQRRNRPSIKVLPVDDNADKDTARVLTGLIRNIEVQSKAYTAYNTAYDGASSCGMGAWRVLTEYAADDVFDQDIRIKRIKNQFTVYVDPAAQEADFSDAEYMFITEKLPRKEYIKQYPNAARMEFQAHRDEYKGWVEEDTVRVCEYFRRKKVKKRLYLIVTPDNPAQTAVFEEDLPEIYDVVARNGEPVIRDVETHQIEWMKCNAAEILEGPQDWAGRYIPIVIVTGKELNIENKTTFRGIVRHAKDPMRLYNYNRSQQAEVNALAPRAPYILTPKQISKHKRMWDNQHRKSYPYLLFNPDPKFPGKPERQWPQPPSVGIQQEIILSDQELHDTTGLPLASMGEKSNEKSGKAIQERRLQGDMGQIVYADNLTIAMEYCGRILVDLIPKIYDVPRVVRIMGEDDTPEHVTINAPFEEEKTGKQRLYDVTTGKYDVIVSVGPSYQSQRQEAAVAMTEFITAYPDSAPIISDLLVKNMDWPGSDEIAERLKKLVPPQILAPEPEDGEQPPPPTEAELEMQAQQAAVMESEAKIKLAEAEQAEVEVEIKKAELRKTEAEAKEAEIEANMASQL
jgi:hypothetical protein